MFKEVQQMYSTEIAEVSTGALFNNPYPSTWTAISAKQPAMQFSKDGLKLAGQVLDDPNYWRCDFEATSTRGQEAAIRVNWHSFWQPETDQRDRKKGRVSDSNPGETSLRMTSDIARERHWTKTDKHDMLGSKDADNSTIQRASEANMDIDQVGNTSTESPKEMLKRYNRYCLLYTSPSPRDRTRSRMPSSA